MTESTKPVIAGAVCAICFDNVAFDEALGLGLFVNSCEHESYQQWYVHPGCARTIFHKSMIGETRDEIAEAWAL